MESPTYLKFSCFRVHGRLLTPFIMQVILQRCCTVMIFRGMGGLGAACNPATATLVCAHGNCYESNGLEVCVCELPWKGSACDVQMSLCTEDCGVDPDLGISCETALCNTGTCADLAVPPYFACTCGDFYTGTNCQTPSNPCSSAAGNPCGHGTCTFAAGKGSGTVTCECDDNYQVPQGATATKLRWGNSEVLLNPACTEQKRRGVAALPVYISSGEMIVWWIIFSVSLLALVWCCYTVCSDTCQRYVKIFSSAKEGGKAARAVAG